MSSATTTTSPPGDDREVGALAGASGVPPQRRPVPGADTLDALDSWVPEPLAPGALGADGSDAGSGLFTELPPLPLTGPLAEAITAARSGLDGAAGATCYLAEVTAPQRLQALQALAEARHVADAALTRLTASFTPEDVRTLGSTDLVDLLIRHTGAAPARANTEKLLAAALTAQARALPAGFDPDLDLDLDADAADPGSGDAVPGAGEDVPFDLDDPDLSSDGSPDGGPDGVPGGGPAAEQATDQAVQAAVPGTMTSAVALGRLGAVHAAGRVSTDIAALATRTVASLPATLRRTHGGAADHLLARLLPGLTHEQARTVCATLAHTLDPERAERGQDPDELERRYFDLAVHEDGWGTARGLLDPETTAELKAFLDARSKPAATVTAPLAPDQLDPDQPDQPGAAPAGGGAGGVSVKDSRRPGQRRHDALAEGIRTALGDAGTRGGEAVRVIVTTTDDQLAGLPGAGQATCETTGRRLSSAQLTRVVCAGALQAVRLSCRGADARVLSLGRSVRLFTASQRRAMLARDGGCVIPGCSAPPAMLEAHHTIEWRQGGLTDVDAGVLLCTRHHVLVTVGVWEVVMVAGVPQVRPPRAVDPLRRWVRNPRRSLVDGVHRAAEQVVGQLLLDPPQGWADDPPPRRASDGSGEPELPDPAPDIPSPRGTCSC